MQIEIADPAVTGQRKTTTAWDGSVSLLPLPTGAIAVASNSALVANAAATATMTQFSTTTNYVTGFIINVGGATAEAQVIATITGLLGGTMSIPVNVPADVNGAPGPIVVTFPTPLPASAVNVTVTLTLPALGAGNTAASVSIFGFRK